MPGDRGLRRFAASCAIWSVGDRAHQEGQRPALTQYWGRIREAWVGSLTIDHCPTQLSDVLLTCQFTLKSIVTFLKRDLVKAVYQKTAAHNPSIMSCNDKKRKGYSRVRQSFLEFQVCLPLPGSPLHPVSLEGLSPRVLLVDLSHP